MPNSCSAFGCTNHKKKKNKPGFFRFPNNNPERRRKWIQACKRVNKDGTPWEPKGKNVYLYGEHFITKRPSTDPDHPDYIPSVFIFKKECQESKVRRFESAKKREKSTVCPLPSFSPIQPQPNNIDDNQLNSTISSY